MQKTSWSKSYPVLPRNHFVSHVRLNDENPFKPSYANARCPAPISSLLRWEYARQWLEERDKFLQERHAKPKHFKNDYILWLEKRRPRVNKNCRPQGVKKLLEESKRTPKK